MAFKGFLGEVMCIVYSEIAYYRYLFPEQCFETVSLVNTVSHRLIKGKSTETDQLLETIEGICDALSKNLIKTLVIGISICPVKPTYVRELYAFQFGKQEKGANEAIKSAKQKLRCEAATATLFLDRLVAFLCEMEPLAPPISIGTRMTLTSNAPADYIPPSFLPFPTSAIESYTILPHCGSARIGKAEKNELAVYMCALCVEGAVQVPTLGSILCAMPMSLDVDEDRHETVFVASPGWALCLKQAMDIKDMYLKSRTPMLLSSLGGFHCHKANNRKSLLCECLVSTFDEELWTCNTCTRSCHMACYGQARFDGGNQDPICLKCRMDNGSLDTTLYIIRQLALARRAVGALKRLGSGKLAVLVREIGGLERKARCTVNVAEDMGLVAVNRDARTYTYQSLADGRSEVEKSLFSSDADVLQRLLGEFFSPSQSAKGNSAP